MTHFKNFFSIEAVKDKEKMKRNTTYHSCDCNVKSYWLSYNESRRNKRPKGAKEVRWFLLVCCSIAKRS